MPLMGSLYVGTSGLQTSQNALNTTAHNMSNLDTKGYVRQQVLLGTREYNTLSVSASAISNKQIGLGVVYSATREVRSQFLDLRYRRESGRSSFYEVSANALDEIQDLIGEMDKVSFAEAYDGLCTAVEELAKYPEDTVNHGLLVQKSSVFIERANAVYQGLMDYQDDLNLEVANMVKTINDYGEQINEINNQIMNIEVGGTEHANDLRDTRNLLLDELAQMVNIDTKEDVDGYLTVKIEGNDFIKRGLVYEIGIQADVNTGYYTPFWVSNAQSYVNADGVTLYHIEGSEVFNLHEKISSDLNTDIGSLKATLLARGDHHATYKDLEDVDAYNRDIAQSLMMNVEAEFDQLVHCITSKMNEIIGEGGYPALFQKVSESDLWTTGNIMLNPDLVKESALLKFIKDDNSVDYELTQKLQDAFKEEIYSLNPNVATVANFVGYYSNLVDQIGNNGSIYNDLVQYQQLTVTETENARQQIMGVSSDEELTNMVKFQNAFNASSRYINVVDEMLEHIINTLGM